MSETYCSSDHRSHWVGYQSPRIRDDAVSAWIEAKPALLEEQGVILMEGNSGLMLGVELQSRCYAESGVLHRMVSVAPAPGRGLNMEVTAYRTATGGVKVQANYQEDYDAGRIPFRVESIMNEALRRQAHHGWSEEQEQYVLVYDEEPMLMRAWIVDDYIASGETIKRVVRWWGETYDRWRSGRRNPKEFQEAFIDAALCIRKSESHNRLQDLDGEPLEIVVAEESH